MRLCSILLLLALAWPARADSLKLEAELPEADGMVCWAEFSADGKTLAAGSLTTICLWEATTWKPRAVLHQDANTFAFSQDGRVLAVATLNHSQVAIHQMSTGRVFTFRCEGQQVLALALAPDGKTLAVSTDDGLQVFEVSAEKVIGKWSARTWGYALTFFRDGEMLAAGQANGGISFWDVRTGKRRMMVKGHARLVESLSFSADGAKLASGGNDGKVALWAVETGRRLLSIDVRDPILRAALSPDGKTLAVVPSTEERATLWDATSGHKLATLKQDPPRLAIAFSPDGRLLAVGGRQGAPGFRQGIKVWKLPNGHR